MDSRNYRDTLLRGIALLGLILILVLGAWGIIVLAFNAPNFLSSAATTISGIFTGEENEEDNTIEVPVVSTTTPTPATSGTGSTSGKNVTPSPKQPTYTYTPAAQPVAQLYGYADLATRIISVVPQGNRYSMTFEVANYGTNTAPAGWMFTAHLPLDPTYTFTSNPQQALRPGDKIVYTLGFDVPYYGYHNDYRYDDEDEERYDECGESHNSWDAEDWFDWYQDTWDTNSDSREDWDEDEWEDWYDDFCDDRDDDYSYDNDRDGIVTITANPFGSIYELNRGNNTASQRINFNYYPTYPTYPGYPYYPWSY